MNIVITGNIGSGKSTFVKLLKQFLPEYPTFSFDEAVHQVYQHPRFQSFITTMFGHKTRQQVSDIVFNDPFLCKKLEEHSIPYLRPLLADAFRSHHCIIEFPLFFEFARYYPDTDLIVAITCDEELQRSRVANRDGFSQEKIDRIISKQHSSEIKTLLADVVVDTSGSLANMERQALAIARQVRTKDLSTRFLASYPSRPLWNAVNNAYNEPHRHYHTLVHIGAMLDKFDTMKHLFHDPASVELAIWFHDFVYSVDMTQYPSNEIKSVKAMWQLFKDHLPEIFVEDNQLHFGMAAELILATRNHKPESAYLLKNTERLSDAQIFLDIDLSVLSGTDEESKEFDRSIRKEFVHLTDYMYAPTRRDVLKRFLARDKVFQSDAFVSQEEAARINLSNLIKFWS